MFECLDKGLYGFASLLALIDGSWYDDVWYVLLESLYGKHQIDPCARLGDDII